MDQSLRLLIACSPREPSASGWSLSDFRTQRAHHSRGMGDLTHPPPRAWDNVPNQAQHSARKHINFHPKDK